MSQENVEIVREALGAYSRGDYDRLAGFHDPHIVVISLEDRCLPYGKTRPGELRTLERSREAAETSLEEVIGAETGCSWRFDSRAAARASGVGVETRFYEVRTLRGGKVLRLDELRTSGRCPEAAWLSE